ncbi:MAG: bifunctional demethylmenaquinone methyltransferase/2-methoxy-6-polyprenyl-1,4-benzoquinol methylase UbiE [Gammaproteobacteria bacterium]|nr:bifunctional demethylmenaquinone methyltransferase/2-methoxy-6-polyprenyl-1,4-benzoquinol methylase UbiE [Gammaproteobacteria bacterium]
MTGQDKHTDFGFRKVKTEEKSSLVADIFRNVAPKYDLMNDLMSFGLHRLWKRYTIQKANLKPGDTLIDVASGTGDLARAFAKIVGKTGKILMTDINEQMLAVGRDRLIDKGIVGNIYYVQADAEALPIKNNVADCVTIAFGLRNVTNKLNALQSMYRVLKPGGQVLILEFSEVQHAVLKKFYDAYSFNVIPKLGELILKDKASYQYLVESIRMHPNQEKLKALLIAAGFEDVGYTNLNNGIVALHSGRKY